ncbi:winged helix-turn-helix transcriptional regulator [Streptomyces umbrinus]|jgi:DNA-binding HxlR family transcriptional regulator|uniref:winged helix-turn-helix transcriptional regulator n=1 Tax=Streptomyces umbrinus TaxID=67370 RepID=UPI00167DF4FF|nr:helix-turn-helix domain-containing protein [Streptomyces umbrinus]MCR3724341.1 DNA-binding HxlR family transcriptional regulator [Streptomyces umbrinus]GHH51856.1 transcriptional regulator [Streptomyces umbrinus]
MATSARRGPYFCGIDAAMDVVAGKWKSLILWELDHYGVRRFAELRRGLPGVSEKMLIQHLREMEEDGLVHREVYREVPPKVEYSLTEHGVSLNAALASLGAWGTERIRRIGAEKVSAERVSADVAETPQS